MYGKLAQIQPEIQISLIVISTVMSSLCRHMNIQRHTELYSNEENHFCNLISVKYFIS